MKKIVLGLVAILMPLSVWAIDFKEGVHYQTLDASASSKPEVREFFSFYCPHCFQFEPFMEELKAGLPKGVKLEKNHVDFLPQRQPKAAELLTKSLIAAQLLNIEKPITNRIFQAIHVDKNRALTQSQIESFFLGEGVDKKKFESAFNNFMVQSQVQQMRVKQQQAKITGVPTVVVNGKYRVTPNEDIKSKGDYLALVTYLTTLK